MGPWREPLPWSLSHWSYWSVVLTALWMTVDRSVSAQYGRRRHCLTASCFERPRQYCLLLSTPVKPWLQLRFDCDTTTIRQRRIVRACFHSTRAKKLTCNFFRRSRVVVESQLWYTGHVYTHFKQYPPGSRNGNIVTTGSYRIIMA